MFELVQKHPAHWPPFIPPTKPEVTTTGAGVVPLKVLLGSTVGFLSPQENIHRWNNWAFLRIKQSLHDEVPYSYSYGVSFVQTGHVKFTGVSTVYS